MAATFQSTIESVKKTATPVEKMSGSVRALGATFLEEGEVFRIPTNFQAFKHNELSARAQKDVCFVVAEILKGDEVVTGKQVFPAVFNRTVYEWTKDENGNLVNMHTTVIPKGQPIDDYNAQSENHEAMKAVAGRKIKVKHISYPTTRNFERTDITTMPVYELEYID